ncbi:uncharacterized protein plekho2 isoform X2 [Antennarius striatus]|uniref:uncharacterized protein plekho2 isoform X2 n=1 Tax=Antennarius striatus TaxID=241820 RepID=UPI0035B0DCFA
MHDCMSVRVKIDESCNLEHVTRTRPKGNQNRRPPSRIHLKQATSAPSKDVLDLDTVPDETLPNGTHCSHWDAPPKEAIHVGIPLSQTIEATEKPEGIEEEAEGEPELQPEPKAVPDDEPGTAGCHKKKVLKPPMPPSKDAKPCVLFVEETAVETGPDSKKSDPPATIPNNHTPKAHPPTPPPKEKKPSHPAVEGDQQDRVVPGDDEPAPSPVGGHDSERASGSSSEEESGETRSSDVNRLSNSRSATPTESLSVNSSPLLTAKVQAEESGPPGTDHREDEETPPTEGQEPTALLPVATATETGLPDVLLTVPVNDGFSPSPALCLFEGGGEGRREEEKSVDSGQDSDDDSEDTLGGSTFALRGSHAVLEVLCDEENLQIGTKLGKAVAAWGSHVPSQELPPQCSEKPSKVWSASSGDLTSESSARIPERKRSRAAASCDDVTNLSAGSPLEMEETHLPFQPASPSQDDEGSPAEATEELKMGDPLLRGVKNLEPAQNSGYRKSW